MIVEESYEGGDALTTTSDKNVAAKILITSGMTGILWILDSKCTFHICHDRQLFYEYRSINGGKVLVAHGDACDVVKMGEVRIKLHNGS